MSLSKRSAVVHGLVFLLLLGLLAGGIIVRKQKTDLYYPASMERKTFAFLEGRFRLVLSMDLLPGGNCGAGKGDVIALPYHFWVEDGKSVSDKDAMTALAEKLAEQGAGVAVYTVSDAYYGTLYRMEDGELRQKPLHEKTAEKFAEALDAATRRSSGTWFFAAAALIFCYLLGFALFTVVRKNGGLPSLSARSGAAALRLTRGKYILSLAAAGLVLLGTLAWLIAPNLWMLNQRRFESGVFFASLLSLPFLVCGALDLLNLTNVRKYRRWLNILCIVLAAVLYGFLIFGLIMMLLT